MRRRSARADQERTARLMPGGVPRWIRIYDNGGETADRYTVVFTGKYPGRPLHYTDYLGMSAAPFAPQGIGMRGEARGYIDRPRSAHLGRRIPFSALPEDCKRLVLHDYRALWGIKQRREQGDE